MLTEPIRTTYTRAMKRRFYTRKKIGRRFHYFDGETEVTDKAEQKRLVALAIPPAWRDVQIARSPRAKVQATGVDAAGRTQMIYNEAFRRRQDAAKYQRMEEFARALPGLRRQVARDVAGHELTKDKVCAAVVSLIDQTYFRVGNDSYAREHQSYGVTTLRSKHTDVHGDTVVFDFTGKSGQHQHQKVTDRRLARIIRELDALPRYEIFQYFDEHGDPKPVRSQDVNEYIKRHAGQNFTAKDFRTWGGTLLAVVELTLEARPETLKDQKKRVTACVKNVAKKLGNTPSVTRSSYIDPRIIQAFHDSNALHDTMTAIADMKPPKYMSSEEQCVQQLLGSLE